MHLPNSCPVLGSISSYSLNFKDGSNIYAISIIDKNIFHFLFQHWLSGYEVLQKCNVPDYIDKIALFVSELLIQKQVSRITSDGN